jgi:hypothetical protein
LFNFAYIHNALNAAAASLSISLLLLRYISLLSTGKDRRYRPTRIPARIYHVEVVAEDVPLCGEREAP